LNNFVGFYIKQQAENEKEYNLAVVNILEIFYTFTSRPTLLGNVQISYYGFLSNFRPLPPYDGTLTVWANRLTPEASYDIWTAPSTSYTCNIVATHNTVVTNKPQTLNSLNGKIFKRYEDHTILVP